jgi:hypothetical protein
MSGSCLTSPTQMDDFSSKAAYGKLEDTRNFKGYWFEIFVCKPMMETIPNIEYECNPTDYEEWKHQQGNNPLGYDGVITLPNGDKIHLEMKFRKEGGKVYHCWFAEDWLPRDADIYVTNNVEAISYWDKRALGSKGEKLLSLSEAVAYINGLVYKILHPNQYVYWNSLIIRIITVSRNALSRIDSKFATLKFKTKVTKRLPMDRISVNARLSAPQFKILMRNELQFIAGKIRLLLRGDWLIFKHCIECGFRFNPRKKDFRLCPKCYKKFRYFETKQTSLFWF